MTAVALRDVYLAELNDLYDAEQQVLRELPLLAAGSTSTELRGAFDAHYRQTLQHVERLERLFSHLDERPRAVGGRALRGIIEDARLRHGHLERGDALDAALIAAAQRIAHYEIAAYRDAHSHALSLSDENGVAVLQETLDEEGGMEHRLALLATSDRLVEPALPRIEVERPAKEIFHHVGSRLRASWRE